MSAPRAAVAAFVALACLPAAPAWQLVPQAAEAPSWELALWDVAPYAEIAAAGLPLPPTPAEVAALPPAVRLRHQAALKAALLHRATRALGERHRITRENRLATAALACTLGAPAAFVQLLDARQSADSARTRQLAELAEDELCTAYGVDSREIRFFVEGSCLSAAELHELRSWLPLPALFNLLPAEGSGKGLSAARLRADYVEELSLRRELAALAAPIRDRATADAAAEAMLPLLLRHTTTRPSLMAAPPALAEAVIAPLSPYAAPVGRLWERERTRLIDNDFFGSPKLRALDYLLH